jgi:hypothetical protein
LRGSLFGCGLLNNGTLVKVRVHFAMQCDNIGERELQKVVLRQQTVLDHLPGLVENFGRVADVEMTDILPQDGFQC